MDARTRLLVVDDDASVRSESRRMFELGGAEVTITAMEYDLVTAFLANPNRVLSREPRCIKTVRNAGYMFIPNTS